MLPPPGALAPAALYVHIPFCVSLCPYCDFVVYSGAAARGSRNRVEAFLGALLVEIDLRARGTVATGAPRRPLDSVYIGGGTPSLLSADAVAVVLKRVDVGWGLAPGAEITLEVNPGPDELGDLTGFRAAGINRLSIGAQSLDPAELRALGRRHRGEDVLDALAAARVAGFDRVSVDLLYDIPGQTLASLRSTLRPILDAGVGHVSAYALTLDDPDGEGLTGPEGDHLPVRPGARAWRMRARAAQDEDRAAELYELADDMLRAEGLTWYEISSWTRPGEESRHNLAYWRRMPYEAVGPGAHAFDGARTRRWNSARLDRYIGALVPRPGGVPRLPPGGLEVLPPDGRAAEQAMLGLRLARGIEEDLATDAAVEPALHWGQERGLVERLTGGRTSLTRRGRLLSNELFARLG